MLIQPHARLLFIGDSITDCGRTRSLGGMRRSPDLGDGYVSLVDAALAAAYPDYAIHTINKGISGNTIRDLDIRWKTDVLDLNPDWLVIMIGINDVWLQFDSSWGPNHPISPAEYSSTLDHLIRQNRHLLRGLILMTPYYLQTNQGDPMRTMMAKFASIVEDAAVQHHALFVNTQAAFDHTLQWLPAEHLAGDRVHVNLTGHMVLARAFLTCIEYSLQRSIPSP